MSRTYKDFYDNVLDWELRQAKNSGDKLTSDRNKILPFEQGKRLVNESIKELVMLCPNRFQNEYVYTFEGNTNVFDIPSNIYRVIAYLASETTGYEWRIVPDSTDLNASIKSKSADTIYNSDGWTKNDTLTLKVIQFPDEIRPNLVADDGIGDYDLVRFPREYERLLTLEVKKRALTRHNRPLAKLEYYEYEQKLKMWRHETGGIKKKTLIAFDGHDFGRSRGRCYR